MKEDIYFYEKLRNMSKEELKEIYERYQSFYTKVMVASFTVGKMTKLFEKDIRKEIEKYDNIKYEYLIANLERVKIW